MGGPRTRRWILLAWELTLSVIAVVVGHAWAVVFIVLPPELVVRIARGVEADRRYRAARASEQDRE